MKKILLPIIAFVFLSLNVNAQKQFAGIIKSKISFEGEDLDPDLKGQVIEKETKVLDNKSRTDISAQGVGQTKIVDGDKNMVYFILDISSMAMGVYYKEDTIPTKSDLVQFDYEYDKNDKRTIAGVECYRVTCTTTNLEDDETQTITLYISDDFLPEYKSPEYIGLKGYPLYTKIYVESQSYYVVDEATEIIPSKKIKPVTFLLPSGAVSFKEMPADIKSALGIEDEEEE